VTGFLSIQRDPEAYKEAQQMQQNEAVVDTLQRLADGVAREVKEMFAGVECCVPSGRHFRSSSPGLLTPDVCPVSRRAGELIDYLTAFSGSQHVAFSSVDVNKLIKDTQKMIRLLLGDEISLTLRLDPLAGCASMDPDQFSKVLINLVVNARDALSAGGTLTIETRLVTIPDQDALVSGLPHGPYVLLTITDTGSRVGLDARTRLFEPRFASQPQPDRPGLAVVYGLVRQSGGRLVIDIERTSAARFHVYLPRV
jgi:signal transduction histidine kinase